MASIATDFSEQASSAHALSNDRRSSSSTSNRSTSTFPTLPEIRSFLTWFDAEYRKRRGGFCRRIKAEKAERLVAELLDNRTVERLKAMTVLMWTQRDDAWILQSDGSLHVLRHRAAYLENQLLERQNRLGYDTGYIAQRALDTREEKCRRIIRRLRDATAGPMGPTCAEVAAALEAGATDFDRLDSELLMAARAVVDLSACEAEARADLKEWEQRMSAEAFRERLVAKTNEQIRKRANLPDFAPLTPCGAK